MSEGADTLTVVEEVDTLRPGRSVPARVRFDKTP